MDSKTASLEPRRATQTRWVRYLLVGFFAVLFMGLTSADVTYSGATETIDGAYTVLQFTTNGTFNISATALNVSILVVAGGGAGGSQGGGAGGGGVIFNGSRDIPIGNFFVQIGGGGNGSSNRDNNGEMGGNSSLKFITNGTRLYEAMGGGGGNGRINGTTIYMNGGSGGGSNENSGSGAGTGKAGMGNDGGAGAGGGDEHSGGGGGKGSAGGVGSGGVGGTGGGGGNFTILNGTSISYGCGGGGSISTAVGSGGTAGCGTAGAGAIGGTGTHGGNATNGYGGGGGGGAFQGYGGQGGSGVVIIRYLTPGGVSVVLNSPPNATNQTSPVLFNATVSPSIHNLVNASLYVWFSNGTTANITTISMNTSTNYSTFSLSSLPYLNGYLWSVLGVQGDGAGANSSFASNNSFNLKKVIEDTQSFNANPTEATLQTFLMNVTLSDGITISTAKLNWNGTNYTGSFTAINSTTYQTSISILMPSITSNGVVTFFWYVGLTDGSLFNSSSNQQTVGNFVIDNCATNTIQIMNFTLKDEDNQSTLSNQTAWNTSIKVDVQLYSFANLTGTFINFSQNYAQTNPARVCINATLGNSVFYTSAQVQYTANQHATEYVNIQNYSLNASSNPSENMSLYSLSDENNQVFVITFKDQNFLAVSDALIHVSRKYVEEGAFKTVEIPITDASGGTIANLRLDDTIYTFTVTKYGQILGTFSNYLAKCQNPTITTCEINLNAFQSSIPLTNFSTEEDFLYTLTYNNNTRTITSQFTIPSGASSLVSLNISMQDALSTFVCSDQVTTSSGTLNCVVPSNFGNATVIANLYKDGDLVANGRINLQQKPAQVFDGGLVLLSVLLLLTLVGASVSDNAILMVVSFLIGIILLFSLNIISNNGFIGGTATILFLIIAIIIILVKASRRT